VIAVSDNGRGIDTEAVRAKALSQQLLDPQHIAKMTEKELINLIFLPGFSTAKQVTEISGRGVGMDVVKTNFTKLGGVIDVEVGDKANCVCAEGADENATGFEARHQIGSADAPIETEDDDVGFDRMNVDLDAAC